MRLMRAAWIRAFLVARPGSERERNGYAGPDLCVALRGAQKLKTLIMFGILLCLSTVMLSMVAVKGSTDAAASQVGQQLKAASPSRTTGRTIPALPGVVVSSRKPTSTLSRACPG